MAVLLFFVFGGVVAASLPAIIGGLSILASLGIMRADRGIHPGALLRPAGGDPDRLGIAIDYGLFIVSRFREDRRGLRHRGGGAPHRDDLRENRGVLRGDHRPPRHCRCCCSPGILKSITYAIIASVMMAAILSITVLAAILAILGPNVDALGVRTLLRVPFLANWSFSRKIIDWVAERTQKTKTREEVENGFWGKLVNRVMKRPILFAGPIVILMILLIIPLGKLSSAASARSTCPEQLRATGTGGVRQDLPRFPHRTADAGDPKSDDGEPVTDQQVAGSAIRPWHSTASPIPTTTRMRCGRNALPRRRLQRSLGPGDPERAGEPQRCRQEDLRTAIHHPAEGLGGVGGTPPSNRTASTACSPNCR